MVAVATVAFTVVGPAGKLAGRPAGRQAGTGHVVVVVVTLVRKMASLKRARACDCAHAFTLSFQHGHTGFYVSVYIFVSSENLTLTYSPPLQTSFFAPMRCQLPPVVFLLSGTAAAVASEMISRTQ